MTDSPPLFAPEFFDFVTAGQESPAQALTSFALALDTAVTVEPDWIIESAGNRPVRLTLIDGWLDGVRVGFESLDVRGEFALAAYPSGWVVVTAKIDGREVFSAFAERIWEEFELYPAGCPRRPAGKDAEAPGRLGKRMRWMVLSAEAWPQLAPLAEEGFVMARTVEA